MTASLSPAVTDYQVTGAFITDVGCHRKNNEDCSLLIIPEDSTGKGALAIVADGMGGHAAGETASNMAVSIISRVYYADSADPNSSLARAFEEANRSIHELGLADPAYSNMGTTCTALSLTDGKAYYAHIGDTRLYLIRNGAAYLLSEDHSYVMEMVRQGILKAEEAANHPNRNVLLNSMGIKPEINTSLWGRPMPIRCGDRFLLCSDGLYELVSDSEIVEGSTGADLSAACAGLVSLAKERGGYDNITVVLLEIAPKDRESVRIKVTREGEAMR
ncbi:MAG: serine/threonine-protein phosphatase [Blastocatellia bacterium]|nr:serine/threonine-protein phosphatase [Blastocatellia bacterium]